MSLDGNLEFSSFYRQVYDELINSHKLVYSIEIQIE